MSITRIDNNYIIVCPHCKDTIIVNVKETNCCIFRHGVYKHNMTQINPHCSKQVCDMLRNTNQIYGCGKPFQIDITKQPYTVSICDYI